MPAPTIETLPICSSIAIAVYPDLVDDRLERRAGDPHVLARDGEGHVGVTAFGDRLVLDDHVDVDVGVGQRGEDPRGDARVVGHAEQRDPGLAGRVGHGCNEWLLQGLLLRDDNGTGAVLETRTAVDPHAVVARVLDGA